MSRAPLEPSEESIHELMAWIRLQASNGVSETDILRELERTEWSPTVARSCVDAVFITNSSFEGWTQREKADAASDGLMAPVSWADDDPTGDLVVAAIGLGIAGLVSYFSYEAADPGGRYIVMWGPAVFGGWKFLRGMQKLLAYPDQRDAFSIMLACIAAVFALAVIGGLAVTLSKADTGEDVAQSLKPGDCIEDTGEGPVTVRLISCDEVGSVKVANTFQVPDQSGVPSISKMDAMAEEQCSSTATSYIGPSESSWKEGDRLVICLR